MASPNIKRIMIFGRSGCGKTTFAHDLSKTVNLPIHHLDKYFDIANWIERDHNEFLQIQQSIVGSDSWIIDGNNTRSLEMRWEKADLVLYFNLSKITCYFRVFKSFLNPSSSFDDRASGCKETINWSLLKYMWGFEEKLSKKIKILRK